MTPAQSTKLDDALAAIQAAERRYCAAAQRRASDSVIAARFREIRAAQRAFHDVSVEIHAARAGGSR